MKYQKYLDFKQYLWEDYCPLTQELTPVEQGFQLETNWAKRNAPRLFRALQVINSLINSKFNLIDVGAYPGSFSRLAKVTFGESIIKIYACGMTPDEEFEKTLATEGIAFFNCNIDPDIKSPFNIPVGLPLADNSVDCIALMEVVEHLYSLKTIMLECYRILKPNGICYVTTNNISDRVGLLRVLDRNSTNLDEELEQTSIWSDYKNTWRGHVRFFSLSQLCEVGKRSKFEVERAGYFQQYEDPDVFIKQENNWLCNILKKNLQGNGSRPPIFLKTIVRSIFRLGIKSLSNSYSSHIEIVYRKPS